MVILDPDQAELSCIDQILHFAIDKNNRVHAMTQSKGEGSTSVTNAPDADEAPTMNCMAAIPSKIFKANNLTRILSDRINDLKS